VKSFSVHPFNRKVRRDHKQPHFFLASSSFQEKSSLGKRIIPDIAELYERQPKDLKQILRLVNGGEEAIIADLVHFTTSRKQGTDWDRIAREFERDKHPGQGATFTSDGKLYRMLDASYNETELYPTKISHKTNLPGCWEVVRKPFKHIAAKARRQPRAERTGEH
jgi:hypothetical protein